ncbi:MULTISPECIES: cytochrome c biogenesis CcdA family protein [Shouchella]|uniref:Cytochrome c biogenesis protein CcdA n=3 Tax=Bacillaceae TaxID=186817 RepID=A0A060M1J0_9BACI|nr:MULTISPECIES: cytochrome c biogenesis CcdA family protein [Bacillaceae]RQW19787.1 cytochrome c biogenesis protein CcdA [Bacillus sp. C1-1]AIC93934.1 cytochrome c biogenesis protein CcdA [Shouchella lehensis G1]KQL55874.1 disulfide bond formation protein DsbD [Alkalicoccobacillus plakortidis]MBG9785536.1 cytochrome C biogenesis protein DsbD [Shouchella lehensis]TES47974.1 cytochrome c biogenesis protein CcdA [Shouchella lehensis]
MEVTFSIAFFAGLVSFFSPCIFPLMPAYLSQLTGTTVTNGAIAAPRRIILSRSFGFIAGFTLVFMLFGLASTMLGQLFVSNQALLERLGGIVIILFGLQMTGLISIRALFSDKRLEPSSNTAASFSKSLLFGFLFAAGWTPCIGLVLASILTLASTSTTIWNGVFLLFIYSVGLGIPFLLIAMLWARSLHKMRRLNRYLPIIQKISGVMMIILGVLLFTGYFSTLAAMMAQYTPSWMK